MEAASISQSQSKDLRNRYRSLAAETKQLVVDVWLDTKKLGFKEYGALLQYTGFPL